MSFPKSCRGEEAKIKIVRRYLLSCVGHLRLLPGQSKQGCCGVLTDQYYAFEYRSKEDESDLGVFYVGRHCAIDFQELHRPYINFPRFFDPLRHVDARGIIEQHSNDAEAIVPEDDIDPLNAEVQIAIYLILTIWNAAPTGGFARILNFIKNKPTTRTQDWTVKKVNEVVGQHMNGQSLREALLAASNGEPVRIFNFPLMEQVLAEQGLPIHL